MSDMSNAVIEKYHNDFLKEVEANVEEGEWVRMCMQCGVCSGSCPLGPHWAHPPQEIFMMIRAGKREEVLSSDSMWMCTSCYNCIVRCPRGLPITHIMHGLAHYAHVLDLAPKNQPTRQFAKIFWDNIAKNGRANELKMGLSLYFKDGFGPGVKEAMKNKALGQAMMKTKRMNPMEFFGVHGVQDKSGLHAMLEKAREIEEAKLEQQGK